MAVRVVKDAFEALKEARVRDGATIMIGGFGLCGIPENLISATRDLGFRELTIISNNAGVNYFGAGILLLTHQIKKFIATYTGGNRLFEEQILKGEVEVELIPQGTFVERIRAKGAGIPAFYTPTGAETLVAEGKETRRFDGREYLLEKWMSADFAYVKAFRGDKLGNLVYRYTARNVNPMMATAADLVIAEVEELVEVGELDPDLIHTPGVYVDFIFQGQNYVKMIEERTTRSR